LISQSVLPTIIGVWLLFTSQWSPWPVQDATDRERKIWGYSAWCQIEGGHLGLFKTQLTVRVRYDVTPLGLKLKVAVLSIHSWKLVLIIAYECTRVRAIRATGSVTKGLMPVEVDCSSSETTKILVFHPVVGSCFLGDEHLFADVWRHNRPRVPNKIEVLAKIAAFYRYLVFSFTKVGVYSGIPPWLPTIEIRTADSKWARCELFNREVTLHHDVFNREVTLHHDDVFGIEIGTIRKLMFSAFSGRRKSTSAIRGTRIRHEGRFIFIIYPRCWSVIQM
jgi:hypothetical protein